MSLSSLASLLIISSRSELFADSINLETLKDLVKLVFYESRVDSSKQLLFSKPQNVSLPKSNGISKGMLKEMLGPKSPATLPLSDDLALPFGFDILYLVAII